MRKLLLVLTLLFCSIHLLAQVPAVRYSKYIKSGFDAENIFDAEPTPDGGYIIAGADSSTRNTIEAQAFKYGAGTPWLAKLDSLGNLVWEFHSMEETVNPHLSSFTSVALTLDGGYIAVGYAYYTTYQDFYVVKLRGDGSLEWRKKFGGSAIDEAYDVVETAEGNYVIAGSTASVDRDVTGNHGSSDVWLICVDRAGALKWQKCLGGTGGELADALIQTPDNGFLIAGVTTSADGDLTGNKGDHDGWLVKTDSQGNVQWQKNYGGSGLDWLLSVVANSDGSYTAAGYTSSPDAEGYAGKGQKDIWLLKVSGSDGQVVWSKGYGSELDDRAVALKRTLGNEYVLGGYTASIGSGGNAFAVNDVWLLRYSADGGLVWRKSAGADWVGATVVYNSETDYIIMGTRRPAVTNPPDGFDGYMARLGDANTIKGTVFFDANGNGTREASEPPFSEALVRTTSAAVEYAATPRNGAFEFGVDLGTYSTAVHIQSPYYRVVPPAHTSTFTTYLNTDSIGFAVQATGNKQDLVVAAVPLTVARPGFNVTYQMFYKNVGTTTIQNGAVVWIKDPRLQFVAASRTLTSISGDTLRWAYANFKPFDSASPDPAV